MKKFYVFFFLIITAVAFSRTAYIYRDITIIKEDFSNNSNIIIPANATSINFSNPEINIISKIQTNIYRESIKSYLTEYEKITNEIEQLKSEKKNKENELEAINRKIELIEKLTVNLALSSSSKGTDILIEKYYTNFENELKKKHKTLFAIEDLDRKIKDKEIKLKELKKIINENTISYYIYNFENPSSGEVTYNLDLKWKIVYVLNKEDNKIDMNIAFSNNNNIEIPLDKLTIVNYSYNSPEMERILKPSKSYLSEKIVYSKLTMKSMAPNSKYDLLSESAKNELEVSSSDTGFIFEINKKVKLTEKLVLPLLTNLLVSTSGSYFAIPLKSSWGYYGIKISNISITPLVPGEMLITSKKESTLVKITNTILQNSSYELSGIETKEIEVIRTKVEDFNDNPDLLRNTIINKKTFEIKIKNRLSKNIDLTILDRIPLPSEDRIKLKDIRITDKNENEIKNIISQNGIIEWKLNLKPGEEKKIYLSYKTEYPANFNLYEGEE